MVSFKPHWPISGAIRHQVLVFLLPEHFPVLIKVFFQHAWVLAGEVIQGTVAIPIVSRPIIGVARHDECVETGSGI